ncbi:MAG: aldehyde dehydrogenase [Bacilli bacterium]|jgi:aldehyde dehydrogenase (NAD+)|nr:aldehyde dehydrogenase [Bacilli bacterium]MDD3389031.1 aldehyde dehydrogenase [Bacilli bacterium]MDD4344470.1 aldehyde dehydrogenase [Bacilli bacterium]MDD4520626.1 aldehyde dehydrogenase [Bacilli bacterium]MDY0399399.1 aldehyde dehydrogenase [Bacilli bacterium]
MDIKAIVLEQKKFFATGQTLNYQFRLDALKKLLAAVHRHEEDIFQALKADLGKSQFEAYLTEVGMVYSELNHTIKHLKKWMKPEKVKNPLANFPGKAWRQPSPFGNVLIMSPWNYPILLTLDPLICALSAGNTAVVKPGSYSKNVSLVLNTMLSEIFEPNYVAVVLGGRQENAELLDQKFEYIFFTGSPQIGHLVQEKASVHLTPITLELGGKSPTIIDETANIKLAAERTVFGKFLNCGQTCVAPDYFIVHESVHDQFVEEVKKEIVRQFGPKPLENENYGKIINEKHFTRVSGLIHPDKIVFGGTIDAEHLRIEPTILDHVTFDDPVMGEEIFGPIMPIMTYKDDNEVEEMIAKNPTPLALYLFTTRREYASYLTQKISFGGGCINDVIVHLASNHMPFGGVGNSGMGSYHGKWGFETFSHYKSIHEKKAWPDLQLRYQPYSKKKLNLIKKFLK